MITWTTDLNLPLARADQEKAGVAAALSSPSGVGTAAKSGGCGAPIAGLGLAPVTWRQGSRGAQRSRFAMLKVWAAHGWQQPAHLPRVMEWLLVEWPQGEPEPTKHWLAQLGAQPLGLRRLVCTAKARWRIEQDYRELKEELGLEHYEGRQWLGWHHHVCLVTIAYAFLRAEQARLKKNLVRPGACPQVRKQLLALLIRLSGRCAWCLTKFSDSS